MLIQKIFVSLIYQKQKTTKMTYIVTVTKGKYLGSSKSFTDYIKANNWADKKDNQYGSKCTLISTINNPGF